MLQEAMDLLEAGLCVIPLRERSKRPALASWKPYQKSRPDAQDLQRWFASGDRNLAVVCGEVSGPPGLGLAVLDFDRPGFETWAAEHSEIAEDTWISATGREDGRHVWLLVPAGTSGSQFGWGEIKGDGGYIVAPPSLHPGGRRYRWLQRGRQMATVGDLSILGLGIAHPGRGGQGGLREGDSRSLAAREHRELRDLAGNGASPEHLLGMALQRASFGNRNRVGFWLAVQLRDNGYDQVAATNVILSYQAAVAGLGEHAYTVTEALHTLQSAYSHPVREPWGLRE